MSFRSRLAVLVLAVSAPVLTARLVQADPAERLDAEVAAQAAASSDLAVSASIAREDAALQRAIDRKLDARMADALDRPIPVRLGSVKPQASETQVAETASPRRRAVYAVK